MASIAGIDDFAGDQRPAHVFTAASLHQPESVLIRSAVPPPGDPYCRDCQSSHPSPGSGPLDSELRGWGSTAKQSQAHRRLATCSLQSNLDIQRPRCACVRSPVPVPVPLPCGAVLSCAEPVCSQLSARPWSKSCSLTRAGCSAQLLYCDLISRPLLLFQPQTGLSSGVCGTEHGAVSP